MLADVRARLHVMSDKDPYLNQNWNVYTNPVSNSGITFHGHSSMVLELVEAGYKETERHMEKRTCQQLNFI